VGVANLLPESADIDRALLDGAANRCHMKVVCEHVHRDEVRDEGKNQEMPNTGCMCKTYLKASTRRVEPRSLDNVASPLTINYS